MALRKDRRQSGHMAVVLSSDVTTLLWIFRQIIEFILTRRPKGTLDKLEVSLTDRTIDRVDIGQMRLLLNAPTGFPEEIALLKRPGVRIHPER